MGDIPIFRHIQKRGSMGQDVVLIQRRLNELGYGILAEDGIYGTHTEDAVRRFQMDNHDPKGRGLTVDGIIGPLTWWALFNGASASDVPAPVDYTGDTSLMRAALDAARRELRRNVREIPSGSNRGPEVESYLASVGRKPGDAWCAAFVYWCAERASRALGLENPLKCTGRVASMWRDAVGRGSVISIDDIRSGAVEIPPGAVFCAVYDSGRGHTGFFESREGDTLHTIEGNTQIKGSSGGEGIYAKRRSLSRYKGLKGFIVY